MRRFVSRLILGALPFVPVAAALAGCSSPLRSPGIHVVRLVLPPLPEAWSSLPDLEVDIAWRTPQGRRRACRARPGDVVTAEVSRGLPQAILAWPTTKGSSLRPAGALYPEALARPASAADPEALALDWIGGYAASVADELERRGVDPWGYDLGRLARQAVERCSDPWLLPATEAARRLMEREFRIDAYREPPRRPCLLPEPSRWCPESPFEAASEASIVMLGEGKWRFVGEEGELLASVDEGGGFLYVIRPRRAPIRAGPGE